MFTRSYLIVSFSTLYLTSFGFTTENVPIKQSITDTKNDPCPRVLKPDEVIGLINGQSLSPDNPSSFLIKGLVRIRYGAPIPATKVQSVVKHIKGIGGTWKYTESDSLGTRNSYICTYQNDKSTPNDNIKVITSSRPIPAPQQEIHR